MSTSRLDHLIAVLQMSGLNTESSYKVATAWIFLTKLAVSNHETPKKVAVVQSNAYSKGNNMNSGLARIRLNILSQRAVTNQIQDYKAEHFTELRDYIDGLEKQLEAANKDKGYFEEAAAIRKKIHDNNTKTIQITDAELAKTRAIVTEQQKIIAQLKAADTYKTTEAGQAKAWREVVYTMNKLDIQWSMRPGMNGIEGAVAAIKELHAQAQNQDATWPKIRDLITKLYGNDGWLWLGESSYEAMEVIISDWAAAYKKLDTLREKVDEALDESYDEEGDTVEIRGEDKPVQEPCLAGIRIEWINELGRFRVFPGRL